MKVAIPINNELDIVIARQRGREIAKESKFANIDLALIATTISELTRNIVSYAKKGMIFLENIEEHGRKGMLVIAEDAGPGIESIDLAMQDGYTTSSNSLGLGLPGVKRMMDEFDIESELGKGTTITTKKWIS